MAKTLIKTPFPSTAEVAKKLGVSRERVREVERIVSLDSISGRSLSQQSKPKTDRKKLVGTETAPRGRH